jgi:hypothetical protein
MSFDIDVKDRSQLLQVNTQHSTPRHIKAQHGTAGAVQPAQHSMA